MWLVPIVSFYLMQAFKFNPFSEMLPVAQVFNILLAELLMLLLYLSTGRLRGTLQAITIAALVWGLTNYYVIAFRGTTVTLSDLISLGTAGEVAGNYSYALDDQAGLVFLVFLMIIAAEHFITLRSGLHGHQRLLASLASLVAFAACVILGISSTSTSLDLGLLDDNVDSVNMARKDGFMLGFFTNTWEGRTMPATFYSSREATETLSGYTDDAQPTVRPNIIVIMDESFSDPAVLGSFTTNKDYMPYVHSLMAGATDTETGYLNVSVLGGRTCNTEFEYLTGDSMLFMPRDSVPYLEYVRKKTFSMASYLDGYGYQTIAMHPFGGTGWRRDIVYPLLGFQSDRFIEGFNRTGKLRNYVSDSEAFQQIIDEYEDKETGQPLFCFEVTIQNHSAYTGNSRYSNFDPDVSVAGTDEENISGYLSLIERSDAALQELTSYFSTQSEPTVIVFFGDHQPAGTVIEPILEQNGYTSDQLSGDELLRRYEVPFVIWANYDIPEETGLQTSANYLGAETLRAAGLPLSGYYGYLEQLEQTYPVISAKRVDDAAGNDVSDTSDRADLLEYSNLERYQVFHGL